MAKLTITSTRKPKLEQIINSNTINSPTLKSMLASYLAMADGTTFKTVEAARLAELGLIDSLWHLKEHYEMAQGDFSVFCTFASIYEHSLRVAK